MITFVVNNNYHLYDLAIHLKSRDSGDSVQVLAIPHTLSHDLLVSLGVSYVIVESPFLRRGAWLKPRRIYKAQRRIRHAVSLSHEDVVVLYTEFELMNQFVIYLAKKRNAKVAIIEDGGLPTYVSYATCSYSQSWKSIVKRILAWIILGIKDTRINVVGGQLFPQVSDNMIDRLLVYRDVEIARSIKKTVISRQSELLSSLNDDAVLFLNEPLYDHYVSLERQLEIVHEVVEALVKRFDHVSIKFHPRESPVNVKLQIDALPNESGIDVITESSLIESLVRFYRPKFVVSFGSAALMNLADMGLTAIYLYNFFPDLCNNEVFQIIDKTLMSIGYKHPNSIEEIDHSHGFVLRDTTDRSLWDELDNL